MFGNLINTYKENTTARKVSQVLVKTYSLLAHEDYNRVLRIAREFKETYNEHELAVLYLADFAESMYLDHPKAKSEIGKFIRMSKGAYNRDLVRSDTPLQKLFLVARKRFGIEPDEIEAA